MAIFAKRVLYLAAGCAAALAVNIEAQDISVGELNGAAAVSGPAPGACGLEFSGNALWRKPPSGGTSRRLGGPARDGILNILSGVSPGGADAALARALKDRLGADAGGKSSERYFDASGGGLKLTDAGCDALISRFGPGDTGRAPALETAVVAGKTKDTADLAGLRKMAAAETPELDRFFDGSMKKEEGAEAGPAREAGNLAGPRGKAEKTPAAGQEAVKAPETAQSRPKGVPAAVEKLPEPPLKLDSTIRSGISGFNYVLGLLSALDLEIALKKPVETEVRRGYSPDALSVPLDRPHSIQDLKKYVSSRIPPSASDDMVGNGRVVEIHKCTDMEALKSLAERGFTKTTLVEKPLLTGGGSLLFLTESPETGEKRYALTNIIGEDMFVHTQLQLRFAGVKPRNILIYDHRSDVQPFLDNALGKAGKLPAKNIIGFAGHLKDEFTERALYAAKLDYLKSVFGEDTYQGILRALIAAPGAEAAAAEFAQRRDWEVLLSLPSSEIFRKWENLRKLDRFEDFLLAAAGRDPSLVYLSSGSINGEFKIFGKNPRTFRAGKNIDDILLGSQLFTFIKEDGSREKVLAARFLYGDLSAKLAKTLADRGAAEIIHLGNAGGLAAGAEIGEIHLPRFICGADGKAVNDGLENGLLAYIAAAPPAAGIKIRFSTRHTKVPSALVETSGFIEKLKRGGFDAVDVESSEVAGAVKEANLKGGAVKLSTVMIISDKPGEAGGLTIENMKENEAAFSAAYNRSLHFICDALIARWGFKGVEISDGAGFYLPDNVSLSTRLPDVPRLLKDAAAILYSKYTLARKRTAPARDDAAFRISGKLLDETGLDGNDRALMKTSVSDYLYNALSDEQLARLAKNEIITMREISAFVKNPRWLQKIKREMAAPYTDAEVVEHLKSLDLELKEKVRSLSGPGRSPGHLYLAGGFAKGRFGNNSDLDVLAEIKDAKAWKEVEAELLRQKKEGVEDRVKIVPLPADKYQKLFKVKMVGPRVDLGDGAEILARDNFLLDRYLGTMKKRGVSIELRADGKPGVSLPEKLARQREVKSRSLEIMMERMINRSDKAEISSGAAPGFIKLALSSLQGFAGIFLSLPGADGLLSRFIAMNNYQTGASGLPPEPGVRGEPVLAPLPI